MENNVYVFRYLQFDPDTPHQPNKLLSGQIEAPNLPIALYQIASRETIIQSWLPWREIRKGVYCKVQVHPNYVWQLTVWDFFELNEFPRYGLEDMLDPPEFRRLIRKYLRIRFPNYHKSNQGQYQTLDNHRTQKCV